MALRSLFLKQFRNYEEILVEFKPGINLICGKNARGKTTLLEALRYAMIGRSFRTLASKDLIKKGHSSFYMEVQFFKHSIDQVLRLSMHQEERKIFHNHTALPNLSGLLGILQGVLIIPDDCALIKGSPAIRRQFLDVQLSQTDPLYVHHLTRYGRAMRQRNFLLKQKHNGAIESFEFEMARSAAYIIKQRAQLSALLQPLISSYYYALSGESEELSLEYQTSFTVKEPLEAQLMGKYSLNRPKEMLLGYTLHGPHKDDLKIKIDGQEVRLFASEGQQRSCVNALHFAEWQRLKQFSDEKNPLFMIDDVGMSLDEERKNKLIEELLKLGQVFLTTTDSSFIKEGHKIYL